MVKLIRKVKKTEKPAKTAASSKDPLEGKKVPKLLLASTAAEQVKLPDDLEGHWTLLYFYPRDNTPGCTKQACNYRDDMSRFRKLGLKVLGVSADSIQSHEKFQKKFDLNFPLIVDSDKELASALNVYRKKSLYGRIFKGINRDTFLIDPSGVIRKVWRKVNPKDTVQETFDTAKKLMAET